MLTRNSTPRYVFPKLSPSNVKWIKEILPNLTSEIGGAIELNKRGKFERFTVYTSSKRLQMTLPDYLQIEYHLHFDPYAIQLPSVTDLKIAMRRKLGYERKDAGVSGQLNVVFCLKGVVVYRYVGKKSHEKKVFDSISKIMNDGADSVEGMRSQIRRIERISNFLLKLTPWATALTRGVELGKFCLKEFVRTPK